MIYFVVLLFYCIGNINALNFEKDLLESFSKLLFTNTCVEDLGCFYNGPPFCHPIWRPICLSPETNLNIIYCLYTSSNIEDGYCFRSSLESLENSPYKSHESTIFLIHGFIAKPTPDSTIFQIKEELLKYGDFNVIIVDWTAHNWLPYGQAVSNTRVVGADMAKLIRVTGISPDTIHLVGHSLGAHVAGYCGERIPGLNRITGLDPAGSYYNNMDDEVCLDQSDALHVDVIHTDAAALVPEGFGTNEARGCLDFYPNGGSKQPGCIHLDPEGLKELSGDPLNDIENWISCDHCRAVELFKSSISNCSFKSVVCSDYEEYQKGVCTPNNSVTVEMGFHCSMDPRWNCSSKIYLKTSESSPFC